MDYGERGGVGEAEDCPHIGNKHQGWDILPVVGSKWSSKGSMHRGTYYRINVTTRGKKVLIIV